MDTTPPLPSTRSRDEEQLGLLAMFHYVVGALGAFFACFPLLHVGMGLMMVVNPGWMSDGNGGTPPPAAIGYLFMAMGLMFVLFGWALAICTIVSGRFIARRRRRLFSIVIAALLCAFMPFGTILGVFTLIVLSRDSVQRLYAETGT